MMTHSTLDAAKPLLSIRGEIRTKTINHIYKLKNLAFLSFADLFL